MAEEGSMRTRGNSKNRRLNQLKELLARFYRGEELSEIELQALEPFLNGKVWHLTEALRISSVRRALDELALEPASTY